MLLVILATGLRAQQGGGLRFYDESAELKLGAEYRDETRESAFSRIEQTERSLREDLELGLRGAYYHRRLVEFDLRGTVGLEQTSIDSSNTATTRSIDSTNFGFDLEAIWFQEHSYSARTYANRAERRTRQSLFDTTEAVLTESGFDLLAKEWWIPSRLHYHHYTYDGRGADTNEEARDNAHLEGTRTAGRSRYHYKINYNDIALKSTNLRFQDYDAFVSTSHGFGSEPLNNVSFTVRGREQTGDLDTKTLHTGASGHVQWAESLGSDHTLEASLADSDLAGTSTDTYRADSSLLHELYDSLDSRLGVNASRTEFASGRLDRQGGFAHIDYRKLVPFGRVTLNYRPDMYVQDERSSAANVTILDEAHVFTAGLPIFLGNAGVDQTTIVITDSTGLIVYSEPTDYILVSDRGRIRIDVPIGSMILDGQTILADYLFAPRPDVRFLSFGQAASIGFQFSDWGALEFGWTETDQRILSGSDPGTLQTTRSKTATAELFQSGQSLRARWVDQDSTFTPYERVELSAGCSTNLFESVAWRSSASVFRTRLKGTSPRARERGLLADTSLDIVTSATSSLNLRAEYRWLELRTDEGRGFLVEANFAHRFRKSTIDFHIRYSEEAFEIASDQDLLYAQLTVSRRF